MCNQRFETEGFKGRVVRLYHMTSKQAASSIISSQKMIPGLNGMFGGGIYFAETHEACLRKARHKEVLLQADVEVGLSYVCRTHNRQVDFKKFVLEQGFDSIKAMDCVNSPEYVVYKSSQVKNIRIVPSIPLNILPLQQTQIQQFVPANQNVPWLRQMPILQLCPQQLQIPKFVSGNVLWLQRKQTSPVIPQGTSIPFLSSVQVSSIALSPNSVPIRLIPQRSQNILYG